MKKFFASFRTKGTRVGGYSVLATVIVLAVLVFVNIIANRLPSKLTEYDLTRSDLFDLSEETEKIIKNAEQDITVYWLVSSGAEDKTIHTLLNRYSDLSDRFHVEVIDPDRYPSFLKDHNLGTIINNSLLIVSGERERYVSNDTIFLQLENYSTGAYDTEFDGEGAITTAVNYVLNGKTLKIYATIDHGETILDDTYLSALGRSNHEVIDLSLMSAEIPGDCDLILINNPSKDFTADEVKEIEAYVDNGGKLLLITMPSEGEIPNLTELSAHYGLSETEGVIIEGNPDYYAARYGAYALVPELIKHEITQPLIDAGYPVFFPISAGIGKTEESAGLKYTYTDLLTTTNMSFSKIAGYNMQTYEKEEGDIAGPFTIAMLVELREPLEEQAEQANDLWAQAEIAEKKENADKENVGEFLWFTSNALTSPSLNEIVSGANEDLFINSVAYMTEQKDSIAIHSKSLNNDRLSVSSSDSLLWTIILIAVPVTFIAVGIFIVVRRRRG